MRAGEPVAGTAGRKPRQHHEPDEPGFQALTDSDIDKVAPVAINNGGWILEPRVSQLMHDDSTAETFCKVEPTNRTDIARYFAAVTFDKLPRELRFLHPRRKGETRRHWWNDSIPTEQVLEWIGAQQSQGWNCYVTINPQRAGVADTKVESECTKDCDIASRVWLPIDCDPIRQVGTVATPEQRECAQLLSREIIDWYTSEFPNYAKPVHGCSGSGFQVLLPCNMDSSKSTDKAIGALLKWLGGKFNSDGAKVDPSVSNASRIMRILGTRAHYANSKDAGRGFLVSEGSAGACITFDDVLRIAPQRVQTRPAGIAGELLTTVNRSNEKTTETPKIHVREGTPESFLRMKVDKECQKLSAVPAGSLHDAHRRAVYLLAGIANRLGLENLREFIRDRELSTVKSNPACADAIQAAKTFEDAWAAGVANPVPESELPVFTQAAAMQAVTSQSPTSVAEVSLLQGANTDGGRGRMLGEFLDGKARHVHEWKENGWLWWDGCRWKRSTPTVHQAAKGWLPNAIAARFGDYKAAKEADAKKSITDALWWISTDPRILLGVNDIDANGWLFNCANGTMDLDAMKFRPADPEDRITKISPTAYDPDAKCPHFMGTLEYFVPDPAVREMIQTHAGSALTGIVTHLKLPILHGHGNNGKSTIIVAIMDTLGADYAVMLDAEVITATGQNGRADAMYHVADLHGKRLVVVNELEESATLKTSALKKLISSDPVKARRPYEMPFDFSPSYKAFMLTNHRPRLKTTDHGTMRRLAIVPFNVTIDPAKDVKNFNRTLQAETPGILNWLIEGCLKWKAAGMAINIPQAVTVATDSYATDEDQIGQFFAACVNKARGGFVTGQALFEAYRRWCESSGYDPATLTAFGRRAQQAYLGKRSKGGVTYENIVVKFEPEY